MKKIRLHICTCVIFSLYFFLSICSVSFSQNISQQNSLRTITEDANALTIAEKLKGTLREGQYEVVNAYFAELVKTNPVSIDGDRLLEKIYTGITRRGNNELWESWANSNNPSHSAYIARGKWHMKQAYLSRGDNLAKTVSDKQWKAMRYHLDKAEADLKKAYLMEPSDPNSAAEMITVCLLKSYPEGTMNDWFDNAVKADPKALGAYRKKLIYIGPWWFGSADKMYHFAESCNETSPAGSAVYSILFEFYDRMTRHPAPGATSQAKYSMKNSDVQERLAELINRFTNDFPKSRLARLYQGKLAYFQGNPSQALQIYNEILSNSPAHHNTLITKGYFYYFNGNHEAAIAPLAKAFDIEPDPRIALYVAACLQATESNNEKEVYYYDKALEVAPLRYDIVLKRGYYYKAIGNYGASLRDFTKALQINPQDLKSYYARAELFMRNGTYDKAREDLLTLKSIDSAYQDIVSEKLQQIIELENRQEQLNLAQNITTPQLPAENKTPTSPKSVVDDDTLLDQAEIFYFTREAVKAKKLLNEVLKRNPENAKASFLYGQILANLEVDHIQAIHFFNKALQFDPTNLEYILTRGKSQYKSGMYDLAVQDFTHLLQQDPTNGAAYYYRGLSFDKLKDIEHAIGDMQNAKLYDPEFTASVFQYLQEHAEPEKPIIDPTIALYEKARDYMMMNRFDDAEKIFKELLDLNNGDGNSYMGLARIALQRDRDHKKAVSYYNKAIKAAPSNKGFYSSRAAAYQYLDEHEKAIIDYGKMLEIDPKDSKALSSRATCYLKLNKFEEAHADLKKAKRYDPGRADYYNKQMIDIEVKLNLQTDRSYENASTLISRSDSYLKEKEFQLAVDDLNNALKIEPDNHLANHKLGKIYKKTYNDGEKALIYFNKSIELNPSKIKYILERALLLYDLKKWLLAIADFTELIEAEPQVARYYYYRGNCYKKTGNIDGAAGDFKKALELDQGWASAAKGALRTLSE